MIMATRCLAVQFAGQPLPPGFTSVNVFSISANSGGDLITVNGPTVNVQCNVNADLLRQIPLNVDI